MGRLIKYDTCEFVKSFLCCNDVRSSVSIWNEVTLGWACHTLCAHHRTGLHILKWRSSLHGPNVNFI